jgi:hypothetical protein
MNKDGGPAFPYSALTPEGPQIYGDSKGMTMRQWYKGMALQGMLSGDSNTGEIEALVKDAGKYADAMVAEDLIFSKKEEDKKAFKEKFGV